MNETLHTVEHLNFTR